MSTVSPSTQGPSRDRNAAEGLPNLIVIGAKKAATTSLHHYLGLHPEIAMSPVKELNFFIPGPKWDRGVAWYRRQFPLRARVMGECCPQYANFPHYTGVAERMHGLLPAARLIYMLRDPLERIVADYVHKFAAGNESRPFAEALARPEDNPYVYRSRYHLQLLQYLPFYDLSSILLLTQEELLHERRAALRRIFEFLGVDAAFDSPRFDLLLHETRRKRRATAPQRRAAYRLTHSPAAERFPRLVHRMESALKWPFSKPVAIPAIPDDLHRRLVDILAPDVESLECTTGQTFPSLRLR
jgi:hypothetical protein